MSAARRATAPYRLVGCFFGPSSRALAIQRQLPTTRARGQKRPGSGTLPAILLPCRFPGDMADGRYVVCRWYDLLLPAAPLVWSLQPKWRRCGGNYLMLGPGNAITTRWHSRRAYAYRYMKDHITITCRRAPLHWASNAVGTDGFGP